MNFSIFKLQLKFYLLSMFVLLMLRTTFLLFFYSDAQKQQWTDILHAFLIGTIIDSSVVSVCIILAFLFALLLSIYNHRTIRNFFGFALLFLSVIFFINIIDIFYFEQFGIRFQQFGLAEHQSFGTVIPMIYNEYPIIQILLYFSILIFVFVFYCVV